MIAAPLSADGDSLRNGAAVFVDREGFPVVANYGSVAAEIAVCMKAAGLVDRSGLDLLVVEGPALLVGHVLAAAAPGSVPEPGTADCVGGTWCARTAPEHAIVAGMPSAVARWRQITRRAIAAAALPVRTSSPGAASALSLVGPKAPILLERAGLAGDLVVHGVATGTAGGDARDPHPRGR